MDRKIIRRRNLRALVREAGSVGELAQRVDTNPSYISQLTSESMDKRISDEFAERLEAAMRKPPRWMDQTEEERARLRLSDEDVAWCRDMDALTEEEREAMRAMFRALRGVRSTG